MARNTILEKALGGKLPDATGDVGLDDLRAMLEVLLTRVMEAEVSSRVAAERYERSEDRSGYRNGTRLRRFDTRLGTIDLAVPKVRAGGYMPSFLDERSRSERALVSVVQEAVNCGVATRRVEKVFKALGIESISKSQASALCEELNEMATAFRQRPLTKAYPYVLLDAMYEKVRINRVVVSQAVVIAYGVGEDGNREVIGADVVASESLESWQQFLRDLKARGLQGVRLVVSDAHAGLKAAIATELTGASWQRCKVHFMRNVLAHVSKAQKEAFAADLKSIFAQPTQPLAKNRLDEVIKTHRRSAQKAVTILEDGAADAFAYYAFPQAHWRKIATTNPVEHLNRDIRRRTRVVGIFPSLDSALRIITIRLIEETEDWSTERRYMDPDSLAPLVVKKPQTAAAAG
jgi:putative transposase